MRPGTRCDARRKLLVRRFTNKRARACANGCTFQHALAGNRRGACAHGSPYGAAFTRGFTFVAVFEHGTRACANNGTANGGFQIFARGRANGSTCYRASGGFGHFYNYAPVKIEYAIDRFTMEAKRLFDVLDKQLARGRYVAGEEYTIADIAIWPWFGCVALGSVYNAAEFLDAEKYTNVQRWAKDVANRHAVKRGRIVNRTSGELNEQLHERHAASDFETNTEDKRQA